MRKFVRLVDENGLFIEDAFVDELTEFTIETPCPAGFYRPKWNGEKWVEGLKQEEINELTKPRPKEISLEERLEGIKTQNELALAELAEVILGGML